VHEIVLTARYLDQKQEVEGFYIITMSLEEEFSGLALT
jgi:hypothetical protein